MPSLPTFLSKKETLKLFVEAGLIIFSVLLALFLNEYRTNTKNTRLKNQALTKVKSELENNLRVVENWHPYHTGVLENIREALNNKEAQEKLFSPDGAYFWKLMNKGVVRELIDDTAWETFRASDAISELDFDTMYTLANVYRVQQDGVQLTIKRVLEIMSSRESLEREKFEQTLFLMHGVYLELVSQEEYLIIVYKNTLKKLNESLN